MPRYVAFVFAIIWLGLFSYRYIDPESREARKLLSNLSSQEIMSIVVEPARSGYPTVVNKPVVISDKKTIAYFSKVLSKMSSRDPEHPNVIRAAILRIYLKGHVLGGYLEESNNDGTTFYCMSDVTSGMVYGTYLVPHGSDLFNRIAQLTATISN